jgi:hypothetical protein
MIMTIVIVAFGLIAVCLGCLLMKGGMKQIDYVITYEYTVRRISHDDLETLNKLGAEGWRLVSMTDYYGGIARYTDSWKCVFIRQKIENEQ